MASHRTLSRPLAPHLQVWKWGPHMLVSILHRATGTAMATVGTVLLVWFLAALASGAEAYADFRDVFTVESGRLNIIGYVVGVGLTWTFFQHMANGIRHLLMDIGAGFELNFNKKTSLATLIFSPLATLAFWAILLLDK